MKPEARVTVRIPMELYNILKLESEGVSVKMREITQTFYANNWVTNNKLQSEIKEKEALIREVDRLKECVKNIYDINQKIDKRNRLLVEDNNNKKKLIKAIIKVMSAELLKKLSAMRREQFLIEQKNMEMNNYENKRN